jgi:hypothetical protein
MTQTNACYFVGFENVVNKRIGQGGDDYLLHDLTPKLHARLGDWAPVVEPLSAATWDPIEAWIPEESRNVVAGYEVSRKGVRCTIWGITLASKDEAEVDVRFMSHKAMGSELWRFHLRHENSAWRVLDGGPKTRFG